MCCRRELDLSSYVVEGSWPAGSLRPDAPAEVRAARLVALRMSALLSDGPDLRGVVSSADMVLVESLLSGTAWPDLGVMARLEVASGVSMMPRERWAPGGVAVDAPVLLGDVFELTGRCVRGLDEVAAVLGVDRLGVLRLADAGSVLVFEAFGEAWFPRWQLGTPAVVQVLEVVPLLVPAVVIDRWFRAPLFEVPGGERVAPLQWLRERRSPRVAAAVASAAFSVWPVGPEGRSAV